ncbi:MAG: thiamine-phosphate kinase [Syntrophobacterales bacterium]|nr:thiamine-phosphate kinase [Syntrophobacterales bacterium]
MAEAPAGEFGLIAALAELFGPSPPEVILGIGDDCAVLDPGGPEYLLWTVDTLVEGVHFDLAWSSLRQLGRKAVAVNVSDLAAMGGRPAYALLSLGWPPHRDLSLALEVGEGVAEAAREFQVAVIGGDTVASPLGVTLTLTLLGRVPKEELLTRAGARVGDGVYVTGPLGEAAAGVEVLRRRLALPPEVREPLVRAHLDPVPQPAAGRLLAAKRLASACIDLSDGVASDLGHICRFSRVGARVEAARVPLTPALTAAARLLGLDPVAVALTGGEDYQLLFTSAAPEATLKKLFRSAGLAAPTRIGEIIPGAEVLLTGPAGDRVITGRGYDHFRLDREQEPG